MANYIDKRLLKLSRGGGKFIRLDVGDSIKLTYISWRTEVDEKFKKTKVVFVFRNENGEEKLLSTSAKKVIAKMAKIVPGSEIQLTKLGEDRQLDYAVKVIAVGRGAQDEPDTEPDEVEEESEVEEEDEEEADDEEDLF